MTARILLAALPLVLAAGCATPTMQPGMWEMTLATTLDGRSQKLPAARECVTQKDIDDPTRTLPRPNGTCTIANVQRGFDRTTYDIQCRQDTLEMAGRAEIRFAGDRYDGKVTMNAADKGVPALPLDIAISARRVGDCTK
jgi:hypothetical protein